MNNSRRDFLKKAGLLSSAAITLPSLQNEVFASSNFNMSGFAAPKIDKVKVAVIGLGMRGPGAVDRLSYIEGVDIVALCDKHADRVTKAQTILTKKGLKEAKAYSGEDGWKTMLKNEELDLVYITTPWEYHAPMAIEAMKSGAHAATEVPMGLTVSEIWEVVKTSEATKKHCMMLENCCYDFFEMLTLNMVRQGLFGELVHAEGAYIHDLLSLNFDKNGYDNMWRLRENIKMNGNLYPTHGIGPIAQCMNINCGDKLTHLVAMQSNDFMMADKARELAATDDFFKEFVGKKYRGNMDTTLIKTEKGKTLMVQHDVTSPRPYSRIHLLSGTKGFAQKYPQEGIAFGHSFVKPEELKKLYDQYTPELVKFIGEQAKEVGGHGGMDFMMDWRMIDCLRNGLPLDQTVYDGAVWSAIVPLSVESVSKNSRTVDIPDFTRGNWKTNKPHDMTLNGGGNTKIRPKVNAKDVQLNVK
ncbi:glycosyl hydrolase family 109 protein 1 [Sphingobacterium mizutaii NBRC 14946 = DSM 11724]|uniref:Glycosyl hydrolase family 109 protein 1 n=2 Tax=Sphingobacterium mizutaii TaxID=1010 RepID=A0AAJ5C1K4_9SPHI|nr:Gfo/Idh/MocA family oxidoreductase [Sphingobacterium mizutaii]GEM69755.1 glycosyl hydrolase family 109 protein 1 [Sphingobacterium mizutaii NBRC 14946 = DSM 11724]SDL69030.1 Oxidoreductase family, NAD-binding Rossmann fold [Sphingobacterium mizutaii]SNV58471.1 Glycosyl hydrolase family 109 protein 1 precursor [Sphingobacterium mizutaii]